MEKISKIGLLYAGEHVLLTKQEYEQIMAHQLHSDANKYVINISTTTH
jgi:phage pi2 protein 07